MPCVKQADLERTILIEPALDKATDFTYHTYTVLQDETLIHNIFCSSRRQEGEEGDNQGTHTE